MTVADFQGHTAETAESALVTMKNEHAVAYEDGKPLFYKTSKAVNYVQFADAETVTFSDTPLSHNHPRNYPISPDDVAISIATNIKKMRAVAADRVYIMRRTRKEYVDDWMELRHAFDIEMNKLRPKYHAKVQSGMDPVEAFRLHTKDVMDLLGAKYGFTYEEVMRGDQ